MNEYFLRYDQSAFPVEEGGRTLGVLTLAAVKQTPRREWGARSVRELTQPLDSKMIVPPEAPVDLVVDRMEEDGAPVFVRRNDRIVGEITLTQVGRYLSRRRAMAA